MRIVLAAIIITTLLLAPPASAAYEQREAERLNDCSSPEEADFVNALFDDGSEIERVQVWSECETLLSCERSFWCPDPAASCEARDSFDFPWMFQCDAVSSRRRRAMRASLEVMP